MTWRRESRSLPKTTATRPNPKTTKARLVLVFMAEQGRHLSDNLKDRLGWSYTHRYIRKDRLLWPGLFLLLQPCH